MNKIDRCIYSLVHSVAAKMEVRKRMIQANERCKNLPKERLSSDEKLMIKKMWGKYGGNLDSYAFYKCFCGELNPMMVPDDYYYLAEHVLNLRWAAFFMQHKFNLKYFIPKENRAVQFLQRIDRHFVLEDNTEISLEEAKKLIQQQDVFIAKNAFGPGGGAGVRKIETTGKILDDKFYDDLFRWDDMTFENIIHQNAFMSEFNSDSINTIRFVTLNINGHCTNLSSFIRMGGKGSFVDNLHGGGGVLVGVNSKGVLNDFGINGDFEKKYEASSGIKLKGLKVPNYKDIEDQVLALHRKIPHANLIGWDIALNENGRPIVIEMNLDSAVIEAHQIFNGPIFGERREEVMEYIDSKKPKLRYAMITY